MMKKLSENEVEFPASVDEIGAICEFVRKIAAHAGMVEKNVWKLETSIGEACTNIVLYGYCDRSDGTIRLRWGSRNDEFFITLVDDGHPFDQAQPTHPDLCCEISERQIGGLGRYIMKEFLDEMIYEHNNNRNYLTLVKKLTCDTCTA